jgi:hypothetical protein
MTVELTAKQTVELLAETIPGAPSRTDRENALSCLDDAAYCLSRGYNENARVRAEEGLRWIFGWGTGMVIAEHAKKVAAR